jgi:hypothetical protein
MHLEAANERVWRCTWRPRSSELTAARGCHIRASLEMHLDDVIERVLEMYLEAMTKHVWRCTWRWSIWRWHIGRKVTMEAETLFVGQTHDRGTIDS